jgi:tetratricopeptide (TPR) repeat protein
VKPAAARAAAVALAIAAILPSPARPDGLGDAEAGVPRLEDLLRSVDEAARRPDETMADRAQQKFQNGETQYLLGDWTHAAIQMGEALDDPGFRQGPLAATATFYLGDALRHANACGAARPYLDAYLAGNEAAHRGDALGAALDCAMRVGQRERVAPLLADAVQYYQGQLPTELRYLSAKAIYGQTELPADERFQKADAAFATVGPPLAQQAAYFQAILRVERNDLAGAAERFTACAALPAGDLRQREAHDLCVMGLGRVNAELGDFDAAVAAYAQVPLDSPSFDESLYEVAMAHGRAGQVEPALRSAETLVEVSPDTPLASRSRLLQGQLLLAQGKYEAASQLYGQVIAEYSRVRDELDAVLTLHQDPIRYFSDLLAQPGKPFATSTPMPPLALRTALERPELARAAALMQALEAEVRDVDESRAMAERIDAVLSRGDGVDAFPRLRQGYAGVQAVQNATALLQGLAATAALDAAEDAVPREARSELAQVHADRVVLEAKLQAMPRTPEAVQARLDRWRARVDALDREIFALGYALEAARAAIAGAEMWLDTHKDDPAARRGQREGFLAELRKHREVVAGYEEQLRSLRHEVALARDAAGGVEVLTGEARVRAEHQALLEQERTILAGALGQLSAGARGRYERAIGVVERLGQVGAQAAALSAWISGEARRRADGLRAQLAVEQAALAQQAVALEAVRGEARGAVGQVAFRSFGAVRQEFYGFVLKADVGLNDVAWVRKKDRVDRLQKLSMQQLEELKALDEKYKPILKEEE